VAAVTLTLSGAASGEAQEAPAFAPLSAAGGEDAADPALGQGVSSDSAPASGSDPDDENEIVVTGTFQRGSVVGDIRPEAQLDAADIQSFGASNLADLLQELGPLLRSGRGRGGEPPIVLVNGLRVSGFSEIRGLPPEALERVDILPEEVALKYGFRADQRVINFVLRENFSATTVELEPGFATDGGRGQLEAEGNFLKLGKRTRLSLEGEYSRDGMLLESERGVITPPPGRPFSLAGTLGGPTLADGGFGEIDPALSALLGTPTSLVNVPDAASGRPPVLGDFAGETPNQVAATDLAPFRSLLPRTETLSLGATWNRPIGSISATLSGRFESSARESRLGLPASSLGLGADTVFSPFAGPTTLFRYADTLGPLLQRQDTRLGKLGLALNGNIGDWRWSFNANYDRNEADTLTDISLDTAALQARLDADDPGFNPFASGAISGPLRQDRARSVQDLGVAEVVVSGSPVRLPGGPVVVTVKAGVETLRQQAVSNRGGAVLDVALRRDQGRYQASFDLPVTSVKNGVLPVLGDLSLNFNAGVDALSDFGRLTTIGYGLNWSPTDRLRFLVSVSEEEAAPSVQQLGAPFVVTPNVRVFDQVRGETVDITRLDGGNPALSADSRRVIKVGGNWKPFAKSELDLSVNFIDSRLKGQVAGFPSATPEIEAAFPDRFVRNDDGRLIQIDNRPINFAGADRQELRTGLSLFQTIKPSAREVAEAEARRTAAAARRGADNGQAAPRGEGPPRGGGGGGGRRGGGGNRVFVSVFHTLHTVNRILIRDGVTPLDLLNGSAVGPRGGQPRHEIEMRMGANKAGLGGRLSVNWRSGTTVRADPAGGLASDNDLFFEDLGTIDLRLFADLGSQRRLVRAVPAVRGSRLSLNIDNLLNARLQVRNRLGEVPLGYQPEQLDPLGRTVRLQFRKIFFARAPGRSETG
jgi:hypothetical protein